MKVTAKLTHWIMNPNPRYLVGTVIGDKGNENRPSIMSKFRDGDRIHTSLVVEFLGDGKYAKTLNSIYELDPPYQEKI